jgi:hypothetical protein
MPSPNPLPSTLALPSYLQHYHHHHLLLQRHIRGCHHLFRPLHLQQRKSGRPTRSHSLSTSHQSHQTIVQRDQLLQFPDIPNASQNWNSNYKKLLPIPTQPKAHQPTLTPSPLPILTPPPTLTPSSSPHPTLTSLQLQLQRLPPHRATGEVLHNTSPPYPNVLTHPLPRTPNTESSPYTAHQSNSPPTVEPPTSSFVTPIPTSLPTTRPKTTPPASPALTWLMATASTRWAPATYVFRHPTYGSSLTSSATTTCPTAIFSALLLSST